jgi:copper chaperone CopZ
MKFGLCLVVACSALAALSGCAEPTSAPVAASATPSTPVAFNAAGAPTVEFNVPDMMCPEGCGAKTQEILAGLPGAKEVAINFDAKTATVAIEQGKFDADAAVAELKDYGFENSTLKSDTAASGAAAPAQDSPNS